LANPSPDLRTAIVTIAGPARNQSFTISQAANNGPVITGPPVREAKHIIITGQRFDRAVIWMNNEPRKTLVDDPANQNRLRAKKLIKQMIPGETNNIFVVNFDGSKSNVVTYVR
ncbi:MAG: hypothetical protein WAV20_12040, partial [Blastocatellia bacterium]